MNDQQFSAPRSWNATGSQQPTTPNFGEPGQPHAAQPTHPNVTPQQHFAAPSEFRHHAGPLPSERANPAALTAFLLGIGATVIATLLPFVQGTFSFFLIVAVPLGIRAVVLGIRAAQLPGRRPLAIAGAVFGAIGAVGAIALVIFGSTLFR